MSRFASEGFVGRDREFARLAAALGTAVAGRPVTILVRAGAGTGVSRFLVEAERRLGGLSDPFTILHGRVRGSHGGRPYGPIVDGLLPHLAALDDDAFGRVVGPAASETEQLLPDLGPRLASLSLLPARRSTTDPERRQARLLEALAGVVTRAGEGRPTLVVLEDLHRADAGTRAFAAFLARLGRPGRIALIATYQPDELTRGHPLQATLGAMSDSPHPPETIDLPPLDRDELADLIAGIEDERPTASTLVLVAERSGGIPLVAEELLAARRELSGATLTGSYESLVTARLGLRSIEARRVLRLLALAETELGPVELAATAAAYERGRVRKPPRSTSAPRTASAILDPDLAAGVDEGIEHGFLTRTVVASGPDAGGEAFDFRHELVGRAVAADILPFQRPRHHAALAVGLAGRPAAASSHWRSALRSSPARVAALEAAAQAEALDAPDEALAQLEVALELTSAADEARSRRARAETGIDRRAGGGPDLVELQVRAAEAAFAAGLPTRAAAFIEVSIGALDERTDRVPMGLLFDRLARYRRAAGNHDGAVTAQRRAVALVPRAATADRALVLAGLAQLKMIEGTFSESERLAKEALRVAQAVGRDAEIHAVSALTTLGVDEGWGGQPEAGVEHLREARRRAELSGHLDEVFRAIANLTTILDLLGRREEAVAIARDGIDNARRFGLEAVYGNWLRGNAADSLFLLGRWSESRTLSETALEWSPAGVSFLNSAVNLAIVETESGASDAAGLLIGRLLLELETVRDSQFAVPVYQAAASYALWRDDLVDAGRAAERGWNRVHDTEDWVLVARMAATRLEVLAAVASDAHERRDLAAVADSRATSASVVASAERSVRAAGVDAAIGSRQLADAHLAAARAFRARIERRDAAAAWDELARRWAKLGDRYQVARSRWRQAEAALTAGDGRAGRAAARRPLVEAATIAADLGARPLLRAVEALASRALIRFPASVGHELVPVMDARPAVAGEGRAGIVDRPLDGNGHASSSDGAGSSLVRQLVGDPQERRPQTFGLSPREREVLVLIADGRTNREIGERLFISQKTVGVHVGNILAKLDVSGRVEAAAVAIRLGLTDDG